MTILCLASEFKATLFIEEAKKLGCKIILVVAEKHRHDAWPWEAIDEVFAMPILWKQPDITNAISYVARTHKIDRIVALDDYDVETAADLREHLRLPGIGHSVARHFRDKLAMRMRAKEVGIAVPAFTPVFNYGELGEWMEKMPAPWVLKPRTEAGAIGIKKVNSPDEVWQRLNELGDKQSMYLLESFVAGNVYHVDSVIWDGEVVFTIASKYGLPPLTVSHGGGVFSSRTLASDSEESLAVTGLTRQLMTAFGIKRGVSHTEFIRGEDGTFYFLEPAARVGGANLDKLVFAASGVNLWGEMARVQVADIKGVAYEVPKVKGGNAGILTCLSRQEHPDLSGYNAPEVVWKLNRPYHAGLIVASPSADRVESLIGEYAERFMDEFMAKGQLQKTTRV
jgi:biotin carboxylase